MNPLKLFVILAVVLLCTTNLIASRPGYEDRIIYQGKMYSLSRLPMEPYFAKFPEKRAILNRLSINTVESPTGYVATLEFVDNQLYLKDFQLVVGFGTIGQSIISELLPINERLKIDWLSKPIVLKKGNAIRKDPEEGFIYESYLILNLENGRLLQAQELSYQEYENYLKR